MTSRYRSARRIARTAIIACWFLMALHVLRVALAAIAGLAGGMPAITINLPPGGLLLLLPTLLVMLMGILIGHIALAVLDIADRPQHTAGH